ncbi:hypothetical protein NDU88_001007, partial [Pleurodeles waltl]
TWVLAHSVITLKGLKIFQILAFTWYDVFTSFSCHKDIQSIYLLENSQSHCLALPCSH